MPTTKQREAARKNVKKAQAGAKNKQTLKNLPAKTRTALGKEAAAVRSGDAPTRKELEAEARRLDIKGRSKMGKADLKRGAARAKTPPRRNQRAARRRWRGTPLLFARRDHVVAHPVRRPARRPI